MSTPVTTADAVPVERPLEKRVVMLAKKQSEKVQALADKNYTSFSAQLRMVVAEGLKHVNGS